ncbi:DoxX family protein [Halorubrum rutilum]|uniref:DoxX family protein n=1 Tax=Halorubrum rutilum TaxID=1364933 RepID=A0ABD6ARE4_9EURY|nr:DoxX family membrane protein [Halorubrum rutilum]
MRSVNALDKRFRRLLPVILRVLAVTITLYPAVRKFSEYSYRVTQFEAYGIPLPGLAVLVTGVVEFVAIVLIGFGVGGRIGGSALAFGMIVAIVAAGPNPFSVLVLFASLGIVLLGTGPYSYWDPTVGELLAGLTTGLPTATVGSDSK